MGGGPQIAAARQDPRHGQRGRQRREFEEPGEAVDTEPLGGERGLTGGADAGRALAADQAEQGVGLAHPGPRQIAGQERASELADGRAVALGLAGQALDVPEGVDGLLSGEVGAIEGTLAGRDARVNLDADSADVEADGGAISAGPQGAADVLGGE